MFQSCQINLDHSFKNGNFLSWPGLTEQAVENTCPNLPQLQKDILINKGKMLEPQRSRAPKRSTKKLTLIMALKPNSYMQLPYIQAKYTLIKQADFQWFRARATNTSL
jgi:hypothetical protein